MAELSGLTVKLDVDVSEAISGLKAVQREAKKATQELRELESVTSGENHEYRVKEHATQSGTGVVIDDTKGKPIAFFSIDVFSTKALSEELERREGVTTYKLSEYGTYANMRMVSSDGGESVFIEGPAIITVNID